LRQPETLATQRSDTLSENAQPSERSAVEAPKTPCVRRRRSIVETAHQQRHFEIASIPGKRVDKSARPLRGLVSVVKMRVKDIERRLTQKPHKAAYVPSVGEKAPVLRKGEARQRTESAVRDHLIQGTWTCGGAPNDELRLDSEATLRFDQPQSRIDRARELVVRN